MKKHNVGDITFDLVNTIMLTAVIILTLYPFLYIIFFSVSDPRIFKGGLLLFPKGFTLEAYKQCLTSANISRGIFISVSRSIIGPALSLLVTSMTAYVLTKRDLLGHKIITKFFLLTMYLSSGLLPIYILTIRLHLNGSFLVYILPGLMVVFNMILIRTYIESLPSGLEEAALIDGANEFHIFFRIILPLCIPICAAVTLFLCIGHWNAFMDTLFYNAQKKELHTLQYQLVSFLQNQSISSELLELKRSGREKLTPMTVRMAMTVITVAPIAFLYPFLQKYFMKGMLIGAIKG